jgi:hypothetical protein
MNEPKFTPGPWSVTKGPGSEWLICEPAKSHRHSHFAVVRVGNLWGDEGKANARLIAAAPDLALAVEGLLREFVDDTQPIKSAIVRKVVEHARAALAKATGA